MDHPCSCIEPIVDSMATLPVQRRRVQIKAFSGALKEQFTGLPKPRGKPGSTQTDIRNPSPVV